MVHRIGDKKPQVAEAAFIAWNAEVAGDVRLDKDVNVWFSATIRADVAPIRVGEGTSVQDNATLHGEPYAPCTVGKHVTVGHGAILHGCTIGDGCLVGMGSVVLTGAVIGAESVVGAGALVTENKTFPPRSLIVGSPAKAIRTVDDAAVAKMRTHAANYVSLGKQAAADYAEV